VNTIDRSPPGQGNQGLVSIIIIFFNAERFIHEAIASVFAQTYQEWELLLVDDGSTDASTRIALDYAEQHTEKVRYVEHADHQNRGMSASRNLGVRHATGEYVAFLDADDVWFPHKLEEQVAVMAAQPEAAMVYGASQYWHSWTKNAQDNDCDYIPALGVAPNTLVHSPLLLTLALESKAPTPCPSDILLRREIVSRVGGFEEEFNGMFEDQAFLAKVYLHAPVFVAGNCWDRYRQHENSCVAVVTGTGQRYRTGLFYLEWLEKYLRGEGIDDRDVWEALRTKKRRYRYPKVAHILERLRYGMRRLNDLVL
jgi:glycosyltransferase involved in cell wall biosynthesis